MPPCRTFWFESHAYLRRMAAVLQRLRDRSGRVSAAPLDRRASLCGCADR